MRKSNLPGRFASLESIPGALVPKGAKPKEPKPIKRTALSKKPKSPLKKLYKKIDDLVQYAVRIRDTVEDGGTRYGACVSCQKIHPFEKLQGGHYIGRSSWATRWNWKAVNAQCLKCNAKSGPPIYGLSGNPVGYRKELVKRHGEDYVLTLDASKNKGKAPSMVEAQLIYEQVFEIVKANGWTRTIKGDQQ
jgi:hypothetical protein